MKDNKTLFSGIKPTSIPHIGNYLGVLTNWVALQKNYDCIYSIVDYHAITIDIKPEELKKNSLLAAKILLAIGINPKKTILFLQSHVTEHTELAWIFNCLTPVSEMERMTQFKDKALEHKQNVNMGLFDYPSLMAADILLYKAGTVPVGEDQLQHLELTRLIARKFNNRYGDYFPEPQAVVTKAKRIMSLSEPDKKMSKDLGEANYISLLDPPDTIRKKVMKAVTDTGPKASNKMSQGVNNLMELLPHFGHQPDYKYFMDLYKQGSIKYADLKTAVADAISKTLEPIQKKVAALSDQKVLKILDKGALEAQKIADKNMTEIKAKIGLLD